MAKSVRWTSSDLDVLPLEDGTRYEIIDGELYVSRQPHLFHQIAGMRIAAALDEWSLRNGMGMSSDAAGVIFDQDDDVAPDAVWVSAQRLGQILGDDGHLHGAPELVVEVLSPGASNERRDREAKVKLYSRRGVDEYWIVDWRERILDVYRRQGEVLDLAETLRGDAVISSPLLSGFAVSLTRIFAGIP